MELGWPEELAWLELDWLGRLGWLGGLGLAGEVGVSGAARLTRVLRERRGFASTGTLSSGCHGLREMGYGEQREGWDRSLLN